ncbi:hypothetical protein, partial [Pediococcus stilesii]|uniref:hypothetical protein n=1 Tax=Pediococcus stilesii TaxID=331679 RepID=UPI00070ACC7D
MKDKLILFSSMFVSLTVLSNAQPAKADEKSNKYLSISKIDTVRSSDFKNTTTTGSNLTDTSNTEKNSNMIPHAHSKYTQSIVDNGVDEINNVIILDFDDKPKNSDAAYEYNISTNASHTMGIKITSKSEINDFDLENLHFSANWSGASAGSSDPIPSWIIIEGIENIKYSEDGRSLTFDIIFSINQELLLNDIGTLNNIKMLNIRISTAFGNTISQNAGTITFEIVSEGQSTQPTQPTQPTQ